MRAAVLIACLGAARVAGAIPIDVDGDGKPETDVPWQGPAEVKVQDAGGHHLVLVRGPERALLGESKGAGAVEELWTGRLGSQDVDGEWRRELELSASGVMLYETRPDVMRCDGSPARIYPRRFDFGARRFRPVSLVPELPDQVIAATHGAPAGLDDTTRPTVFLFEAATITADDGGSAEGLSAPRELDDGRRETAWSETLPGFGRGALFVARAATGGSRVVALRIVGGDGGRAANRPRRLLIGAAGRSYLFELPDTTGPLWLVLPDAVTASCVDVVLEAVHPGTSARGESGRTAIAELVVLTNLDAGGERALAELARTVATGGPGSADAEHHLIAQRARGATALLDVLRDSGPAEQRRLRLALARSGDPRAAVELTTGMAQSPDDLDALADGLQALGDAAVPALARLLVDETANAAARARAARLLGAAGASAARDALLAAAGGGPRELRQAIIVALAGRPVSDGEAIRAAAAKDGAAPDLWRAAALHARRLPNEAQAALAAAAAERLPGAATALRYRLLQALASLAAVDEARAALARALAAETDAALRMAAIQALADGPSAESILATALGDADPGVRAVAAGALAARPTTTAADPALVARLAGDGWPLVRRAAAEALASRCSAKKSPADGTAALYRAVRADHDENVRRAALAGLVRCREPRVGPELVAVARDRKASPSLRAYATSLLGPLGDKRRVGDLVAILDEARDDALAAPDPVAADGAIRRAAAAAHALGFLDDARGARALLDAAGDGAFPVVQAAALTALGERCPAGSRPVIERAAQLDDALVTRAARRAGERCGLPGSGPP